MGLNAKKVQSNKQGGQQEPLEPDVYRARLVQLIDLGLQAQKPYQGKEKPPVQEIMLTYELCEEFMKDEEGNDIEDKPRWISETLPFYGLFAEKAKSTQRYYALDPEEQFDGEFSKCIGVPVNVTVVNNIAGDKIYNNVGSVAAMSVKKAASCPELVNPPKVFDLDDPDLEVFNALPDWLKDKIKGNLNFAGSPLADALGGKKSAPVKAAPKKPAKIVEVEDEEENNLPY